MRKKLIRVLVWLMTALQVAGLSCPASAERLGSLTMEMPSNVVEKYWNTTPVEMSLYKIAERDADAANSVSWMISVQYADLSSAITAILEEMSEGNENSQRIDATIAAISQIIKRESIRPLKETQMSGNGKIYFGDLGPGLYYMEMSKGPETLFI